MSARVHSCIVMGVEGMALEVEVDIATGLPAFSTVGLPEGAVKESKERVKAAIKNSGYDFPNKRITVNLAPADVKKEGAGYDLPIALGIMAANGLIPNESLETYAIIGELSLNGRVRGVRGVLSMVLNARDMMKKGVIVPFENSGEACVVAGVEVIAVKHLYEAVEFLLKEREIEPISSGHTSFDKVTEGFDIDLSEVKGQEHAKRALEIAASGNHNILFKGPPGAGKTMLARRLTTILPEMSFEEAIDATRIHSIAGMLNAESSLVTNRPFRAPHHTISDAGLIGGGSIPKPGEVSLATHGVLFLDELTEFKKRVLEMLRQPLEDRKVTISRANMSLSFPADFLLVAAYNPCPCGFYGDHQNKCNCTETQIQKYLAKLSGPLLDRMDMHLEIGAIAYQEMSSSTKGESSAVIRERVNRAREIQRNRYGKVNGCTTNSSMSSKMVEQFCQLDKSSSDLLEKSVNRLGLSARAYHRILKLARTIADLEAKQYIEKHHLAEAIQYRRI